MSETMHDSVEPAVRLSRVRVRLEILWLRSDENTKRFRDLIAEASGAVLPLVLLVCESPVEVADEVLTGVDLVVGLDGVLSADEARLLSRSSVWPDRCLAARSTLASADVLSRLARDEDWDVRVDVAENRSAPAEALNLLADEDDLMLRRRVVSNPSTPDTVLEQLVCDPRPSVREAAAKSLKVRRKSG